MADIPVQAPGLTGAAVTYQACAAGGDSFENDGETILHVKNGHTASQTVTIVRARLCDMGQQHNVAVPVPAGGDRIIGPFPRSEFGSPVQVTYSGVTSLTIAAIRGGRAG